MARLFEATEFFGEMTPILELENKDGCASHYKFDDNHEKKYATGDNVGNPDGFLSP